ncbi:cation:proton antiporter [Rhodobacter sp. NTK016B]|uniref:cation:proton antiporter n=1 Tax=Rhodobacter sp. NTK016B TaxID=2759676 RepID=UPI001A8E0AEF|nr:cation:proton antiporter family protein [Rhodobacter sp. NTK016B]MBN8292390.1 cation:proton antiporter [Rhodobacter sp. NTK016B]
MHDASLAPVFLEIALLVLMAAGLGLVGLALRQPLVVAFIAAGILAGPEALGLVQSEDFIALLSQISIAVLLFLVGLKLDVGLIRSLGAVAIVAGLGQVALSTGLGAVLARLMGFDWTTAIYVALALAFSSTIIVVKLLSDKREIDALHGRIALGILIVQDIVVVAAMVVVAASGASGAGADGHGVSPLAMAAGALAMIGVVWVFVRWLAAPLLARIAKAPELVVIFAVGWAAGFAAAADMVGLGKELGGLAAGVSLASTPFRDAIGARLAPLRDFLLLFFFLSLGAGLDLDGLAAQVAPALVLSVFVLLGKPVIVLGLTHAMGYRTRTGFLAGVTLGQISEFGLIFVAMGAGLGLVSDEAASLVTLIALITIAVSVYGIAYAHRLHRLVEPLLRPLERRHETREEAEDSPDRPGAGYDILVLGLGRYGCRIGEGLKARGYRLLGVDFDPEALRNWQSKGLDAHFGDATDPEFVAHLPLRGVRAVISAVPPGRGGLSEASAHPALLHALREAGYDGEIAVTVNHRGEADTFRVLGATLVLSPFEDAAERAAEKIAESCR